MAPGTHCDVSAAFAPAVEGTATGTLSISAAGSVYPGTLGGAGVTPPDTTPPTVSSTSPANGATVSGTITVSAIASDNVRVARGQFRLDGGEPRGEGSTAPYARSP